MRLRDSVSSGAVVRVGRGIYVDARMTPPPRSSDEIAEARCREAIAHAHGTHRRLTADHVFSHATAALLWGLPLWRAPTQTSLLVRNHAGAGADPRVRRRVGLPPDDDVVVLAGLPVTSLVRTLIDCAHDLAAIDALVVADAALRAGASRGAALDRLDGRRGRRGTRQAREVVELADPGAESAGETAARFVVLRDGLPVPTTQLAVTTRIGTVWPDIAWPGLRVALEYDGRVKYVDREDLVREKRRHDALVEAGFAVLRVTKEDVAGRTLTDRVLHATPPPLRPRLAPRRHLAG